MGIRLVRAFREKDLAGETFSRGALLLCRHSVAGLFTALPTLMFFPPADAALSSSFRRADRPSLWKGGPLWAGMRLFDDRIEFVELRWTGRRRQTLPLARVKDLRWRTGGGNVNLSLHLHPEGDADENNSQHGSNESKVLRLHVEAAGLWKHEVEARAPNLDPAEATLPDKTSPTSSSSSSPRARAA
jgi:hypothetical protein